MWHQPRVLIHLEIYLPRLLITCVSIFYDFLNINAAINKISNKYPSHTASSLRFVLLCLPFLNKLWTHITIRAYMWNAPDLEWTDGAVVRVAANFQFHVNELGNHVVWEEARIPQEATNKAHQHTIRDLMSVDLKFSTNFFIAIKIWYTAVFYLGFMYIFMLERNCNDLIRKFIVRRMNNESISQPYFLLRRGKRNIHKAFRLLLPWCEAHLLEKLTRNFSALLNE